MESLNPLRLISALLTLELLLLSNGTQSSAEKVCPIEITPKKLLIPYRSATENVTCTPASANKNVKALYWHGVNSTGTTWQVDTHNDWNLIPFCNATFDGIEKCSKRLDFILYKTPDSVSIHRVDNSSSEEDEILQLRCNISNVAPYQNVTVRWYHGNKTIHSSSNGLREVTGCPPESSTNCDIRTPVNVSYTINITMNRKLNEAEFKCQAQLNLGLEGPQHPYEESSPLNITVYSKPVINTTKLLDEIAVFDGYSEELACEADGHPTPKIQWLYSNENYGSGGKINVSEPGTYTCTATNHVGSVTHEVKVNLEVDYLPLIAGFVALTVVIISVIFCFIYSIYYKNTKMRHYSLKKPNLSTHNGNVAHNGWDLQFPMTKLS